MTDTDRTYCDSKVLKQQQKSTFNDNKKSNEKVDTQKETFDSVNYRLNQENSLTYDSQATELYTLRDFTQNYTHVSQSQNSNFVISNKFITGKKLKHDKSQKNPNSSLQNAEKTNFDDISPMYVINKDCHPKAKEDIEIEDNFDDQNLENVTMQVDDIENFSQDGQNLLNEGATQNLTRKGDNNDTFDANNAQNESIHENLNQNDIDITQVEIIDIFKNMNTHNYDNEKNTVNTSQHLSQTILNDNNNNHDDVIDVVQVTNVNKDTNLYNYEDDTMQVNFNDNINCNKTNTQEIEINTLEEGTQNDMNVSRKDISVLLEDSYDEETSQTELVPFKVVEELNRVKSYLNRRERRMSYDGSSDSGYRSDSQGRCSKSGNYLSNPIAHRNMLKDFRKPSKLSRKVVNIVSRK